MEVVNSKVEELKILTDSATERVKASSVHCLQELLHHLVAFYSSQRFFFVSLVVVDTKTGKEQRFYTFRDLLDHSKYLLSQTEQNKNAQSSQYLERALANRGSGQAEVRRDAPEPRQLNPPSHGHSVNRTRQPDHVYTPQQRTGGFQQQYSVLGPPPRSVYIDMEAGHSQRTLQDSHRLASSVTHHQEERDSGSLRKDSSSQLVNRLLENPESSAPSVATHPPNYINQYNSCLSSEAHEGQLSQTLNSGHMSNRDHQHTTRPNQPLIDYQPRNTVGHYVNTSHPMHYNGSALQQLEHNFNNGTSERRGETVSTEHSSFDSCIVNSRNNEVHSHNTEVYMNNRSDVLQSSGQALTAYSASSLSSVLFANDKPQSDISLGSGRSLRDEHLETCDSRSWPTLRISPQLQEKQIINTPGLNRTTEELPLSLPVTTGLVSNSKSLDLTAPSKSNSDVPRIPETLVRRSLSRLTTQPMVRLPQTTQERDATNLPFSSVQSLQWSSCRKQETGMIQNPSGESSSLNQIDALHGSHGASLERRDQSGGAPQVKKAISAMAPCEPTRPGDASTKEFNAGASSSENGSQVVMIVGSEQIESGRRERRNTRSSRIVSRRKSGSPQKVIVNEAEEKNVVSVQPVIEGSDDSNDDGDGDSFVEIVISDSSDNDKSLGPEERAGCGKLGKKLKKSSSRVKYHCFYCNELDHKVTLTDLLLHLRENHIKTTKEKSGLPCPQCGKIYKHRSGKATGTEGMYSTLLACLNHVMCQHSSPVPDYMRVYNCGQCSFVSLIKTIVKRHELCHMSQEDDSQCKDCGKNVKKQSQKGHRAHCPAVNENELREEHKCNFCEKKYSSKSALAIHIERKHKNINSFLCSMCPSSFYAKVDLERHMYAQHSVNISKRAVIKCPDCDYQSLEGSLMRKHIKNHQMGTFKCDICSKEFGTENRLKSHRMIHTAERKYKCDHCDYATAKRYHFERHVAVRHKGQFWKCSSCSMLTFNKNNLRKHITKAHGGNAEIKEVTNLKESSHRKTKKTQKKRAANAAAKGEGASDSDHENAKDSPVALYSTELDVDNAIVNTGGSLANFDETVQDDHVKLDSALGMVLDQDSPGLLAVKSPALLWPLQ